MRVNGNEITELLALDFIFYALVFIGQFSKFMTGSRFGCL